MGDMYVKSGAPDALQQRAVAITQAMVFMASATSKKYLKINYAVRLIAAFFISRKY